MATAIPIDQVLGKLSAVRQHGDQWMAQCPAHDDRTSSLSVGIGRDGKILLKCFAGCPFDVILDKLQIRQSECFATKATTTSTFSSKVSRTYDYRDLDGLLRYQVCRLIPKDFRQRRPDGVGGWLWNMEGVERFPYHLDKLKGHETVYIVEGEKDADALWALGLPATTNSGGTGSSWKESDTAWLTKAGVTRVILIPDNDAPGRKHMDKVAKSVKAAGMALRLLNFPDLPPKEDVSYWLHHGHTGAELEALVADKPWVLPRGVTALPPSNLPPPPPNENDPLRWHLTDLGAAESFVAREGNNVRYDYMRERWLLWNANLWHPDTDAAVHRLAHAHVRQWQQDGIVAPADKSVREALAKFLFQLESRSRRESVIATARTLKPVADPGDKWDKNPWLLAAGNGIVDLRTGVLRPGDRSDNLTMQTTTPFVPEAPCPRWEQFLSEVFDGDAALIRYVQQALGYSLTGDTREQCFFMCVGSGSNGKSTFTGTLQALWGDYAYTTDMKTFSQAFGTDQGMFDMAELMNRRLILASETKAECRLNEQALKNFTGGEKINAQRKYGHPFEYQPCGKIWLGMNHQPTVKDDSHGFWRRVRIIPFLRTFGGSSANPHLREDLAAEASGILAWAVRGTLEWLKVGLQCPTSVFNATEAYQQAEDPLQEFIADCLMSTPDTSVRTSSTKLYAVYREWAQIQGLRERQSMTAPVFGRSLSRHFQKQRTDAGTRYLGVYLKVRTPDLLD